MSQILIELGVCLNQKFIINYDPNHTLYFFYFWTSFKNMHTIKTHTFNIYKSN